MTFKKLKSLIVRRKRTWMSAKTKQNKGPPKELKRVRVSKKDEKRKYLRETFHLAKKLQVCDVMCRKLSREVFENHTNYYLL